MGVIYQTAPPIHVQERAREMGVPVKPALDRQSLNCRDGGVVASVGSGRQDHPKNHRVYNVIPSHPRKFSQGMIGIRRHQGGDERSPGNGVAGVVGQFVEELAGVAGAPAPHKRRGNEGVLHEAAPEDLGLDLGDEGRMTEGGGGFEERQEGVVVGGDARGLHLAVEGEGGLGMVAGVVGCIAVPLERAGILVVVVEMVEEAAATVAAIGACGGREGRQGQQHEAAITAVPF